MRVIFMGTPQFALPTLETISSRFELAAIITQPDKGKGRRLRVTFSPVKRFAVTNHIKLLQPTRLKDNSKLNGILSEINPDVIVVAAYGRIMPAWLLDLPKYGCVNLHASLLPEYRGAAPIQRAIMDGKKMTGVSTIKVLPELDAGPVYLSSRVKISETDNALALSKKLSLVGAKLVLETLQGILEERLIPKSQDETGATYAPKISKEEMEIDWQNDYKIINNLVRALAPRPGAYTTINNKKVKIINTELRPLAEGPPGTIISTKKELIVVAKNGSLALQTIKPEGKSEMSGADFARGSRISLGAIGKNG